jgi:hypothetical protein
MSRYSVDFAGLRVCGPELRLVPFWGGEEKN